MFDKISFVCGNDRARGDYVKSFGDIDLAVVQKKETKIIDLDCSLKIIMMILKDHP